MSNQFGEYFQAPLIKPVAVVYTHLQYIFLGKMEAFVLEFEYYWSYPTVFTLKWYKADVHKAR